MQPRNARVAIFRLRAHAIFHTYAYYWLVEVERSPVTREYAAKMADAILETYWRACRRNPTIREWAANFKRFAHYQVPIVELQQELERERPAPHLNVMLPWELLYSRYGRDDRYALRQFAEQTACAFGIPVDEIPHQDWTRDDTISDALRRLAKGKKKSKIRQILKKIGGLTKLW